MRLIPGSRWLTIKDNKIVDTLFFEGFGIKNLIFKDQSGTIREIPAPDFIFQCQEGNIKREVRKNEEHYLSTR